MRLSMGILALYTILLGIFSGWIVTILQSISGSHPEKYISILSTDKPLSTIYVQSSSQGNIPGTIHISSISSITLALMLLAAILLTYLISKYGVNRRQKVAIGTTWDCGTPATPRMEITATGFSRTLVIIFKSVLRPRLSLSTTYQNEENYMPASRSAEFSITDIFRKYFYEPVSSFALITSAQIKKIQSGNINLYFLYSLITLIGILCITML